MDVLLECTFSYMQRDGRVHYATDQRDERSLGPVMQAEADEVNLPGR